MKIIVILNELYNNNKLENKRFKTPDGTILNNAEALLDYVGVSDNEWYSLNDFIETLQSEVEVLEDKEYEDIEELNLDTDELLKKVVITAQDYVIEGKINALIRNQKKILERLDK